MEMGLMSRLVVMTDDVVYNAKASKIIFTLSDFAYRQT